MKLFGVDWTYNSLASDDGSVLSVVDDLSPYSYTGQELFGVDWTYNSLASDDASIISVVDDLSPYSYTGQKVPDAWESSIWDGGKFAGGFGPTQLFEMDYWTLRARSAQLFNENLYARGLIRRLITNEISTGLLPEAAPDEAIIGVPEDSLADWTETVENRFGLWGKSPGVCDWEKLNTFGAVQRIARMEALIDGDVLVVLRFNRVTGLPAVQLVSGNKIRTPLGGQTSIPKNAVIRHGVQFDSRGRQSGFWVRQDDGSMKFLPAFGSRSGRRLAWLVYGTEKRLDEVRGQPLLSIILQSLKEIDRYRDSTQRKAVINSIMAMFIEKGEDKPGTLPMQAGAVRHGQAQVSDNDGTPRNFKIASYLPGMIPEELQQGEKPHLLGGQGTDLSFGEFEGAIIQAVAWANEVPPEILTLAFSNNYSASQAAINEFKIYLHKVWSSWGENFCSPIYVEWLLSETLQGRIIAPGLLAAWRNPRAYDVLAAWISADWYGSIKPSTDMLKQTKGSKMLVENGWSTNAREARITTGTKFSKNIKRLARENQQLVEALRPMLELRAEMGALGADETAGGETTSALVDSVIEAIAEGNSEFAEGLIEVLEAAG